MCGMIHIFSPNSHTNNFTALIISKHNSTKIQHLYFVKISFSSHKRTHTNTQRERVRESKGAKERECKSEQARERECVCVKERET